MERDWASGPERGSDGDGPKGWPAARPTHILRTMLVAHLSSAQLLTSIRRAARPDEDVVSGARAREACRSGFPRAAIRDAGRGADTLLTAPEGIPTLLLHDRLLGAWEGARREGGPDVPPERTAYVAFRVRMWLNTAASRPSWVDLCLRDLARVVGRPLPAPFRGMARRVLEFPSRYPNLEALGSIGGLSAGALKARFRRRGLASPYTYLRWLRCVAVGHILTGTAATTLEAAHRLGISGSGNLCRTLKDSTGLTSTQLRSPAGRERLLVALAEGLLAPSALEAWESLGGIFIDVA